MKVAEAMTAIGEHAAARALGRVAEAEARDRDRSRGRGARRRRAAATSEKQRHGDEERRAGAEERAGGVDRFRRGGADQAEPEDGEEQRRRRRRRCATIAVARGLTSCGQLVSRAADARRPAGLRSEIRAKPRSVHQMQTIAATIAPSAPATSETGDTCSVSAVVPTAPDHHVRRPAIISAP